MKKEQLYRDTKNYYLDRDVGVSSHIISFVKKHAGNRILDVGCATARYMIELSRCGFDCTGVDINQKYVVNSKEMDLNSLVMDGASLAFKDDSFDTVLMIEVLEHVPEPMRILKEASRVAKKNILITVPSCGQFEELHRIGLTYEHFLELDHINFFTKETFECLISENFKKFKIEEEDPINMHKLLPYWLRKPLGLLYKLKIIKPLGIYTRLFAVIYLKGDVND